MGSMRVAEGEPEVVHRASTARDTPIWVEDSACQAARSYS